MQSPGPGAHDKVLDDNPDQIGIYKCWFLRSGENQSTQRKTFRSRVENQQQTQPTIFFLKNPLNSHMTVGPGIKPRTHWWEASALTTAPTLLDPSSKRFSWQVPHTVKVHSEISHYI